MFVDFNILNQLGSPSINSNTFANRPAAGQTGRLFVSTDTFEIYRDNGAGWDLIGGPGAGTITGTGTATQVAYFTGAQTIGSSANLFWDNTAGALGINTATPGAELDVHGTGTIVQVNATGATSNAYLAFQRTGTGVWRIGDTYNGGSNFFELHNTVLTIDALEFEAATNKSTFLGQQTYASGLATGNQFTYNLTVPNGVNITSPNAVHAVNSYLNLSLGGNTTVPAGARQGLEGNSRISFTGAGTLTMTQAATVRAFSALSSVYSFAGSAIGTVTHLAGLRICFPDNIGSAINITNNYGLLLNDQTAGLGTVTYTNRWGIYQEGASDLNYFNGSMLLGSTTNSGQRLQVTGTALFTGSVTGTGNSSTYTVTAASGVARSKSITSTLVAAANNDVLVGLDINPTFTNGAFTGVTNYAARFQNDILVQKSLNAQAVINTTSTGSATILRLQNNGNNIGGLTGTGSTFGYGTYAQNQTNLTGGSGGIGIRTNNSAPIRFYATNADPDFSTVQMQMFASTGNVTLQNGGTFTDAGFRLDCNGTARIQNNLTILPSAGGTLSFGAGAVNAFRYVDGGGLQRIDYQNSTTTWNLYGGSSAANNFRLSANASFSQTQVLQAELNYFTINREFNGNVNSAGSFRTVLNLTTSIVNPLSNANILRMLYIDPTITNWTTVNSIQVVNGDTLLGTTSGSTSIGATTTINASAQLQVVSTTKGFLPPVMTGAQAEAIGTPAAGLMVYANNGNGVTITTTGWWGYDGATWVKLN